MIKTIPEQVSLFCDSCGIDCTKYGFNCKVKADFVCRDMSGADVGGNSENYDLCMECMFKFKDFFKCRD